MSVLYEVGTILLAWFGVSCLVALVCGRVFKITEVSIEEVSDAQRN